MSLDDENPTQYFGADAVLWKHPDTGVSLSLSPAQARHAARRYFATLPMDNGPLPDTGHRKGCAFGRTARCTCTYLAQWDKHPDYTAPAFSGGPDKPALLGPGVMIIPDELWEDFDPTALKASGAPEFVSASQYRARQEQPAPFPMEEKDYYPVIDKPLKALTVAGEIWEPRRRRANTYTRGQWQWLEGRRDHWRSRARANAGAAGIFFLSAAAGWAYAIARGVWGF
jgi:hypothetical protein